MAGESTAIVVLPFDAEYFQRVAMGMRDARQDSPGLSLRVVRWEDCLALAPDIEEAGRSGVSRGGKPRCTTTAKPMTSGPGTRGSLRPRPATGACPASGNIRDRQAMSWATPSRSLDGTRTVASFGVGSGSPGETHGQRRNRLARTSFVTVLPRWAAVRGSVTWRQSGARYVPLHIRHAFWEQFGKVA